MAKHRDNAKRSTRPNPREDRNPPRYISAIQLISDEAKESNSGRRKRVELLPRNLAQETYVDALLDPTHSIVFAMGPAGTGKTLLATLFAIRELQAGNCTKIILTRPAVSVDEKHGFLPGDINAKMEPWVMPILDVFKEHYSPQQVLKMIQDGVVEIAPLAFMRGRTFKDAIVIADEMQNSLPSQMKMVLTRIGDNSRMIITGDLQQHDRGFADNGLADFVSRLRAKGSRRIAVCDFAACDVERHPVIEEILDLYED